MSMPPDRKHPVQPWIPQRPQQPTGQQKVFVIKSKAADWRPPYKAGWVINGLVFIAGLLIGLAALLAGGSQEEGLGWALAVVLGMVGGGLGWLLGTFAVLVVLVLAIIVMARGQGLRGVWVLAGVFLSGLLAYGVAFGGLAGGLALRQGRLPVASAEAAAATQAPAAKKKIPTEAESALRTDAIVEAAAKMLKVRDEATFRAARNDAFAQAAGDDLTEEHKEALRLKLRAMFDEAELTRPKSLR
jgi:hypothetical protein